LIGLPGIGYATFIKLAKSIDTKPLTATNLAAVILNDKSKRLMNDGFDEVNDVELHVQRVVDMYQSGDHYDANANFVNFNG